MRNPKIMMNQTKLRHSSEVTKHLGGEEQQDGIGDQEVQAHPRVVAGGGDVEAEVEPARRVASRRSGGKSGVRTTCWSFSSLEHIGESSARRGREGRRRFRAPLWPSLRRHHGREPRIPRAHRGRCGQISWLGPGRGRYRQKRDIIDPGGAVNSAARVVAGVAGHADAELAHAGHARSKEG